MEHVVHPAEISLPAIPPREVGIHHEVVLHVDAFVLAPFLDFHAVEQGLVDTIRHSAAERSGVDASACCRILYAPSIRAITGRNCS